MPNPSGKRIAVRRSVDFLRVPEENVLDLRGQESEPEEPQPEPMSKTRRSAVRGAVRFLIVAVLVGLPVAGITLWQHLSGTQGKVFGTSTEAASALTEASEALANVDSILAQKEFEKAASSFREARSAIDRFRFALTDAAALIPGVAKVQSGRALLVVGEEIAEAGKELATLVTPIASGGGSLDFPRLLSLAETHLNPALDHLDTALGALEDVDPETLPSELAPKVAALRDALPALKQSLTTFRDGSAFLVELLGGRRIQRYLVLFQNNLELRATGGFLGSLALVDVAQGKVTKLEVPSGGTYDFKGQLTEKVIAPEPLHIVNPHWQLQDANWWPDFPTSAKKILWFYEKSGGPTVDGIIALTPDVLKDLLTVTGPIDLTEQYGMTVTAESVVRDTLLAVQENPEQPKQIIADLVPLVLNRLVSATSIDHLALLSALETAVREKHLLFYFPNAERQERVARLGWAGALGMSEKDMLAVVDTNIGGGKTDGVIDELIEHEARIADDGTIDVTVTITRTHHGAQSDPWTGVRNVDFIRFYVPKGSAFVAAEGFERIDPKRFQVPEAGYRIDDDVQRIEGRPVVDELTQTRISEELGFTVFANWLGVGPGESVKASLSYRLPFTLNLSSSWLRPAADEYSLLVIKQPGVNGRFLTSTLRFPEQFTANPVAAERDQLAAGAGFVRYTASLDTDRLYGVVLEATKK